MVTLPEPWLFLAQCHNYQKVERHLVSYLTIGPPTLRMGFASTSPVRVSAFAVGKEEITGVPYDYSIGKFIS
jgi:hypothetical protein